MPPGWMKTFLAPSLNVVGRSLIFTAIN
jgi:hypothetical protein